MEHKNLVSFQSLYLLYLSKFLSVDTELTRDRPQDTKICSGSHCLDLHFRTTETAEDSWIKEKAFFKNIR